MGDKEVIVISDPIIKQNRLAKYSYSIVFDFKGKIKKGDILVVTEEKHFNGEKEPRHIFYTSILISSVNEKTARAINIDITNTIVGKVKKGDKLYKRIL